MNPEEQKPKTFLIKALAILGFIATVILIAWLLFKAIQLGPSLFSSLASIINSMEEYKNGDELVLTTEKDLVNSDEAYAISFNKMRGEGDYTFNYSCTDGVSAYLVTESDETKIECNKDVILQTGATSVTVAFLAEKKRFTDISYTISFLRDNETIVSEQGLVTVLNSEIPENNEVPPQVDTSEPVDETEEDETETPESPVSSSTSTVQKPVAPKPITQYVTIIPQSDPNGFVDLAVRYVAPFVLNADGRNSIVVEVKNIGTKTSPEWEFELELPDGRDYRSDEQTPLRPNEQATLTIGFEMDENDRTTTLSGEVKTNDFNKLNNRFSQFVTIN